MYDAVEIGLAQLAKDSVPSSLLNLEEQVLSRVASDGLRETRPHTYVQVTAVAGALLAGFVSGFLPSQRVSAEPSLATISGASGLTPTSILLEQL